MNDTTAALLDLFQIDRSALDASRGFYRNRNSAAYMAGLWGEPCAPNETYLADHETPDCPEGWDTYRGHLVRTEPYLVSVMDRFADTDEAAEAALTALCRMASIEPLTVSAPAWLSREGVFQAPAFPKHVLEAFIAAEGVA